MKLFALALLVFVLSVVSADVNPLDYSLNDPFLEQLNEQFDVDFDTSAKAVPSLNSYHDTGLTANVDEASAKVFVTLAAASYCTSYNSPSLEYWNCTACRDSGVSAEEITRLYAPEVDGNGFVAYLPAGPKNKEPLIVVSFRGSKSIQNWLTNLDFGKVDYKGCSGCQVHKGFLHAYSLLRPQLVAAVANLAKKYPTAKVSVTGHSLGGALAQHALADLQGGVFTVSSLTNTLHVHTGHPDYDSSLSATHLQLLGANSIKVPFTLASQHHTFGQPRVGNPAFVAWFRSLFNSSVMRHTHWTDPVPHLPPISFGFGHVTREIWWNKDMTSYTQCDESNGEDSKCSNAVLPLGVDQHMQYCGYAINSAVNAC